MYVHRLRHYIGAYRAQLSRLDALIFTGGIGEHAAPVRSAACRDLSHLGIVLDESANRAAGKGLAEIHAVSSPVRILIVPTDEESEIARQTIDLLQAPGSAFSPSIQDHRV
jgi:acetate kinase